MNAYKLARYRSGLDVRDVVARIDGLTEQTLYRFERGERIPRAPMLKALADVYNTTVDSLLGIENEVA